MSAGDMPRSKVARMVWGRVLAAIPLLAAMFFLPAGTLNYWQAWLYLAVLFVPMSLVLVYLLRNAPGLLERRMRMREKEVEQKLIVRLSIVYFVLTFLLPGFDRRYGWSDVPAAVVILADVLVLFGYGLFFPVLRENEYASRIIEVEKGQKVITTGPYAVVRHPMYLGASLMYVLTPLALGSWWAMIPAILIVPLLVARILNEEQVLRTQLEGYVAYTRKVKYRLLPGIW